MVFPGMMPKNAKGRAAVSNARADTPDNSRQKRPREMARKGPDNMSGPSKRANHRVSYVAISARSASARRLRSWCGRNGHSHKKTQRSGS